MIIYDVKTNDITKETVGILIDEIAQMETDGLFEFDAPEISYEKLKDSVVSSMVQCVTDILHDSETDEKQKVNIIISSLSYLSMQNFMLWYDKRKRELKNG